MAFPIAWLYRKAVTLTHASGTLTNYQKKILVGESAGATGEAVDCGGSCKTDFSDLRFSNAAGDPLNYWIESITGTTPNQLAIVWVKFDSIGTGATTFYMYYGNAAASTAVSGTDTFDFWEDWDSIDAGKWTKLTTDGTVTAANSILSINNTTNGSNCGISAVNANWSIPVICEWKYRRPSYFRNRIHMGEATVYDWGDFWYSFYWNGFTGIVFTNNVWYIHQGIHLNNSFSLNIYDTAYASTLLARAFAATWVNNGKMDLRATESTSSDFDIDWVRSRQYTATEPVWGSWGVQAFIGRTWSPFPFPRMY